MRKAALIASALMAMANNSAGQISVLKNKYNPRKRYERRTKHGRLKLIHHYKGNARKAHQGPQECARRRRQMGIVDV